MTDLENEFIRQLEQLHCNVQLTEYQLHQLRLYYENLLEWNARINLTAITDENEVYVKHFLDSYTFFLSVSRETLRKGTSIIDIGTGAGFPGLPLAIVLPQMNVTLVDSLGKRIRFLEDTINKLSLNNVISIHARAEDLARDSRYREQYDYAVSRAVANLSTLAEYCIPYIRKGGKFIAYKSEKIYENEEMTSGIKAAQYLGAELEQKLEFQLPETDYKRVLVTFNKKKPTPGKYPRKAGVPSKDPLK